MKLFTTKPSGGNALLSFLRTHIAVVGRFTWLHTAPARPGPSLPGPHVIGARAFLLCHNVSVAP
jgi:hypothetical protein